MKKNDNRCGLIWIAVAAILWSVQGVLGKANTWSPLSITAIRAFFAAIVIGIFRRDFKPEKGKENWIAAFFVAATGLIFLSANSLTTSANAVVIQYMMPVFVILFSWLIWKYKPTKSDVICCIIMLMGVALCFLGGLSSGNVIGNLLAVLSAVSYAGVYLSSRVERCNVVSYAYQGFLISMLISFTIPFDNSFSFDWMNLLLTAAMGICVGLGYVCLSVGFNKNVNPISASIVSYIEPVLNPVWVALFIHERITTFSKAGIIVVLTSAIVYSIISNRRKVEM